LTHVGFQILTAEHRPSHLPVLSWVESVGQTVIPILRRRILVVAERP
jgi:hypothetical protein